MATGQQLCADCDTQQGSLKIRQRLLCEGCFRQYVSSKVLKRMDMHRMRYQTSGTRRRLLIPLSGGTSSLALLHVLNAQVEKQMRQQGRTAYDLVMLHIVTHQSALNDALMQWWASLQECYVSHQFLSLDILHNVFESDQTLKEDMRLLELDLHARDNREALDQALAAARSVTARSNLQEILLKRMIVAVAKQERCDGILWGHSDSKLAAHVLSAVANGRGGSVSIDLAEGPSPWGFNFNYPMRDLFLHELDLFLDTLPEVQRYRLVDIEPKPVTLRSTSIDQLMSAYITGQGEKYPNIMANVVRTASKLQQGDTTNTCKMCGAPAIPQLCYGCEQMKQEIRL